jgi:hypothetical protein
VNANPTGGSPQGHPAEITRSIRQAIARALRRTYRQGVEKDVPDPIRVVMGRLRRHIETPGDMTCAFPSGRG